MSEPVPDLDDFFAKKDRKKTKKKFPASATELKKEVSTLSSSTTARKIPETPAPTTSNSTQDKEAKEDEVEWLDYKEEQEKDYSGLKLRQLAEALPEPVEDTDDNHQEDQTPAEPAWKAVDAVPQPAPAVSAAKNNDEANKSVYISPALRNAALLAPSKLGKISKTAPDLASDAYFPALGTEPPKPVVLGKLNPAPRLGPQRSAWGQPAGQSSVSLGNRYNTLDTDDS